MDASRRQVNQCELQAFYALIGAGIWFLQHVEDVLSAYVVIKGEVKERGAVGADELERMLCNYRRHTLGRSICIAEEKGVLDLDLLVRLKAFKVERNWLVHHLLVECGDDLYINDKRTGLFQRLDKFGDDARQLLKLIAQELEGFVVSKGVSREWIHRKATSEINRKKGTG